MYRSLILFSRHGKLRLSKYFVPVPEKERNKTNHEVIAIALNRQNTWCNIFHHKGIKYCYKRFGQKGPSERLASHFETLDRKNERIR